MKATLLVLSVILSLSSYCFNSEEVELETEGCTLKGTLTTQDDPSSSTALIILIAGSGPTDRDGNNDQMQNNSLKFFSEMLVASGYSCLRYDKRAIGASRIENFDQRELSFDAFISDAVGWVEKYAADARFHTVILAGHSQGSLVAMCAANRSENVAAVVSLSGAGEPIHEVLKWQLSASLSPEIQGMVDAKLDTLAGGDTLKHVPDYLVSLFHPVLQPFLISWMKYDPSAEAAKLKVPFLIVNGTTDVQIKVEQAKMLKNANEAAKLSIIKNMNHIMKYTKLKTGLEQLELYSDPELPLHKKLSKVVIGWLDAL